MKIKMFIMSFNYMTYKKNIPFMLKKDKENLNYSKLILHSSLNLSFCLNFN